MLAHVAATRVMWAFNLTARYNQI